MSATVVAVEKSKNSKISLDGVSSATYVTQATCPDTCAMKDPADDGVKCYATLGLTQFTTNRVNDAFRMAEQSVDEISFQEATAISLLTGRLPLRVHVVGDCKTDFAADVVSRAMLSHTAKALQPSWTYTHAWRGENGVSRDSWNGAAVQASCDNMDDVRDATALGWPTTIVIDTLEFPSDKAYDRDGFLIIPCPQQTGRAPDCLRCGLCFAGPVAARAGTNKVIGFKPDAGTKKGASRRKRAA